MKGNEEQNRKYWIKAEWIQTVQDYLHSRYLKEQGNFFTKAKEVRQKVDLPPTVIGKTLTHLSRTTDFLRIWNPQGRHKVYKTTFTELKK